MVSKIQHGHNFSLKPIQPTKNLTDNQHTKVDAMVENNMSQPLKNIEKPTHSWTIYVTNKLFNS